VKNCLVKHNIDYTTKDEQFFCDDCIIGKQQRKSFDKSTKKHTNVGKLIHTDSCGPMQKDSIGGSKYFLLFKDDFSHFRTVYFIKNKYEVKNIIEIFIKGIITDIGSRVKILRTDNGLEFVNNDITKYFTEIWLTTSNDSSIHTRAKW
jgi:hypothetical protein